MSLRRGSDVLFRAAGGPRVGFGHVLRSLSLARALAVRPRLSIRGGDAASAAARRFGARLDPCLSPRALDPASTRVLVVDDPSARAAQPWVRAARARGIRAVSVHDLGIAPMASDLAIDGSVAPGRHDVARVALTGLQYTVLDPSLSRLRAQRRLATTTRAPRVVIGLGGGARGALAVQFALAIRAACPGAEVRVAGGFLAGGDALAAGVGAIPPASFRRELAQATVAVLAGGVSLYEACALGVPVVALSVVNGQARAVRGFERRGAVVDAGRVRASNRRDAARAALRVTRLAVALLASTSARRRLARRAGAAVDGRGAWRVARAIEQLRRTSETRTPA